MSKGIYVALSGAVAQENALDTVASNVANAASPGYQRLRPVFREALSKAKAADTKLHYAATTRIALDTSQGTVRNTGRPLDVALPQGVYLAANTPRGERYTRAGALSLDTEGVLHTTSGAAVLNEAGEPIKVKRDGSEVRIDTDGSVKQGNETVGKMKLVQFEQPDALAPEGGSMLATGGAGAMTPAANVKLDVGAVEESNASPMTAMTEMMSASRTFEAFQKVLDQFSDIDRKLLTTVPSAVE